MITKVLSTIFLYNKCNFYFFFCLTHFKDGGSFKATVAFDPYFYIFVKHSPSEVESWLRRKFQGFVSSVAIVDKVDLDLVRSPRCARVTLTISAKSPRRTA